MSVVFVNSGESNSLFKLGTLWSSTDSQIMALTLWLPPQFIEGYEFLTKKSFIEHLNTRRQNISNRAISYEDVIKFYTEITTAILNHADSELYLPERGRLWRHVVATSALVRASDCIGIQRALGSVFYIVCNYTTFHFNLFQSLEGQASTLIELSFNFYNKSKKLYQSMFSGTYLQRQITELKTNLVSMFYNHELCFNQSVETRYQYSDHWFKNITVYIDVLHDLRTQIADDFLTQLNQIALDTTNEVWVSLKIVIVACLSYTVYMLLRQAIFSRFQNTQFTQLVPAFTRSQSGTCSHLIKTGEATVYMHNICTLHKDANSTMTHITRCNGLQVE